MEESFVKFLESQVELDISNQAKQEETAKRNLERIALSNSQVPQDSQPNEQENSEVTEKRRFNGICDLSFTNNCSYSGDFLEGHMHGKGKYVWANGTIYEGDFDHNRIHGTGKYIWPDGSSYVGQISNGIRHGRGTFISTDGLIVYSGTWVNGIREGYGRIEYRRAESASGDSDAESYFDGEWRAGQPHGYGIRRYASGDVYEGMWYRGQRHGHGSIRWLSRDEIYTGQWENGVQHGEGEHVWFSSRTVEGASQYALRNHYIGQFVRGKRSGKGVFNYASGAKYEGDWLDDMKHGQGKFTFKNGRIYEGRFEFDRIAIQSESPLDGNTNPEEVRIRTRTPLPAERHAFEGSIAPGTLELTSLFNTFRKDINHLLIQLSASPRGFDEEVTQAQHAVIRYLTPLRRLYAHYSKLGCLVRADGTPSPRDSTAADVTMSVDNTYALLRLQFWRLLKDVHVHLASDPLDNYYTLLSVDRLIAALKEQDSLFRPSITREVERLDDENEETNENEVAASERALSLSQMLQQSDPHDCFAQITFREFVVYLVTLAFFIYNREIDACESQTARDAPPPPPLLMSPCATPRVNPLPLGGGAALASARGVGAGAGGLEGRPVGIIGTCFARFMCANVLPHACAVGGHLFVEPRRTAIAMGFLPRAQTLYKQLVVTNQKLPYDKTLTMRDFFFMLKAYGLLTETLTSGAVGAILAADDERVRNGEGNVNLELEMSFLEFFEALIGCSQVYVTNEMLELAQMQKNTSAVFSACTADTMSASLGTSPFMTRSQTHITAKSQSNLEVDVTESKTDVALDGAGLLTVAASSGPTSASGQAIPEAPAAGSSQPEGAVLAAEGQAGAAGTTAELLDEMGPNPSSAPSCNPENAADRAFLLWQKKLHYFFDRVFFPTANRFSALKQRLKARDDIAAQVVARAAYDSHLRGDDVPKLVTEVSEATSEVLASEVDGADRAAGSPDGKGSEGSAVHGPGPAGGGRDLSPEGKAGGKHRQDSAGGGRGGGSAKTRASDKERTGPSRGAKGSQPARSSNATAGSKH